MKIIRASVWAIFMMLFAYLLGVEWTWRVIALCILSGITDMVVYADYSGVRRVWDRTASDPDLQ